MLTEWFGECEVQLVSYDTTFTVTRSESNLLGDFGTPLVRSSLSTYKEQMKKSEWHFLEVWCFWDLMI